MIYAYVALLLNSVGLCLCVNDQLKSAYTECRAAKSECDLPEYCNGTDPLCPSDVYRRNTDSCTVNGVCQHFVSSPRMLRANPDSFSVAYLCQQ